MARRRNRDDDWIGIVAELAGVLILLSLISPLVRQTIFAVGSIVVCLLAVVVVGLISFGVYRLATSPKTSTSSENAFLSTISYGNTPLVNLPRTDDAAPTSVTAPQTTAELLEQMRSIDWFQFEKVVGMVYRKLGYTVTRRGGANPDGGIDLLIEKGGQQSAVQCKQWKKWKVGVKTVREFLGALTDAGVPRGILITLCGYTCEAKQLAEKHGIEIINETSLAQILESTDAKFDPEVLDLLRDTRKLCPKCENEMVMRTSTKGQGAGKQFWGCSTYPRCWFKMSVK